MPKEYLNPKSLFPSLGHEFSQVVVASGRKMVFISGQTAWDAQKNIVGEDNLLKRTRQALRNVAAALDAAGGALREVVALRIYSFGLNNAGRSHDGASHEALWLALV
jgi:2-iminobutanoate/2-iminopropanoate deaminase